jgi:aromatic ring-opening dioxygenase LigB subunit
MNLLGDVLKLLGEGGLKIMTKLINTIYETGEWSKDFTKVTMIALKKKPQATKCNDHRTISPIAHTAKIVAKIRRRRIQNKIGDVFGERLKRKLRTYSEKISLDLEKEKEQGMQLGC